MGESILFKWFLLPKLIYIFNTAPINTVLHRIKGGHTPQHTPKTDKGNTEDLE